MFERLFPTPDQPRVKSDIEEAVDEVTAEEEAGLTDPSTGKSKEMGRNRIVGEPANHGEDTQRVVEEALEEDERREGGENQQ